MITTIDFGDLKMKMNKTMSLLFRRPAVEIEIDENHISLYPRNAYPDGYHIERSRCRTPEKILGWVNHLSAKNWVDAESLAAFTIEAFRLIGVDLDYSI